MSTVSKAPYAACERCTLSQYPMVPSYIPADGVIPLTVIGDRPGMSEVLATPRMPLVGEEGKLLDKLLAKEGLDPAQVHRTNLVLCHPPKTRNPTMEEITCCAKRLRYELEQVPSQTILALGSLTSQVLNGDDQAEEIDNEGNLTRHDSGKLLMQTYHPAYYMHKPAAFSDLRSNVHIAVQGIKDHPVKYPPKVITINTVESLAAALATCDSESVAFDVETTSLYFFNRPYVKFEKIRSINGKKTKVIERKYIPKGEIIALGLAWNYTEALIIDRCILDDPKGIEVLKAFIATHKFVAHNGKFDVCFLAEYGLWIKIEFDTMHSDYILDENRKHGLKEIGKREFGVIDYEAKYIKPYINPKNVNYGDVPRSALNQYLAWDVTLTLAIKDVQEQQLKDAGFWAWPWQNIMVPATDAFAKMQYKGAEIDYTFLLKMEWLLSAEANELKEEVLQIVGNPDFNPNSTQQVAHFLYHTLRLPNASFFNKRAKPNCTDKEAMESLLTYVNAHYQENALQKRFLIALGKYRKKVKILNSYVNNILSLISDKGRVHCNVKMIGTVTGRLSVTQPALQTIPKPYTRDGKIIRGMFSAPKGYKVIVVDYSQCELRVLAHVTQDQNLIELFKAGKDFHTESTITCFGLTNDQEPYDTWLTPEDNDSMPSWFKAWRSPVKNGVFAVIYGGKPESVSQAKDFPKDKIPAFAEGIIKFMPRVMEWRDEIALETRKRGYVRTMFNRMRRFPYINRNNADDARKTACNTPIQSPAGDLTTIAATQLIEEGIEVFLTVHDSILAYAPEDQAEEIAQHIAQTMCDIGSFYCPSVPWKADIERRKSDNQIGYAWVEVPQEMLQYTHGIAGQETEIDFEEIEES